VALASTALCDTPTLLGNVIDTFITPRAESAVMLNALDSTSPLVPAT
jgi:hypothetical protein